MVDLTTGLIVLAALLLCGWAYSAAVARDYRRRLNGHRDALIKLGMFEPKLREAFGAKHPSWADCQKVIDIDNVIRLGEIGRKRLEDKKATEEYEQVLHILRGEGSSDE